MGNKSWNDRNRDRRNARRRELYASRPEKRAKDLEKNRRYRHRNKAKVYAYNKEWVRRYRIKIREALFAAYGGKCACCGEAEPLFLELDHIHNDGASERRRHGNQFMEWIALYEAGFPKGKHQILCSNCNHGKRRNGGTCPHAKGQ